MHCPHCILKPTRNLRLCSYSSPRRQPSWSARWWPNERRQAAGAQVPGRVGTKRPSGDGATCHFHQSPTFNAVYLPNINHVSFVAYVSIVHCDYQSIMLWWSACSRSHPLTHHMHAGISPLPNLMLHCAHQQLSPPQLVLSLPTYVCRWSMSAHGPAAAMSECPSSSAGEMLMTISCRARWRKK